MENIKKIANDIYDGGGRSRDCGVVAMLKSKYNETLVGEILESLAKVEISQLTLLHERLNAAEKASAATPANS